jgi:ribose/xylose/arabinose/galactoside ABC-type transport system permease subunit
VHSGQPLLGEGLELESIAAVVIGGTSLFGGRGGLMGTLVGVLFVGVLQNGLNLIGVSTFVQRVIIGAAIIVAVLITALREERS